MSAVHPRNRDYSRSRTYAAGCHETLRRLLSVDCKTLRSWRERAGPTRSAMLPRSHGASDRIERQSFRPTSLRCYLALVVLFVAATSFSCRPEPCATTQPRYSPPGLVITQSFPEFLSGRRVHIYLPPGSAAMPNGFRYPLLFMLDGETIFYSRGGWQLNWIVDDLIHRQLMSPIIIVGVESAGQDRALEYNPQARLSGPNGRALLTAIADTLLPLVRHAVRLPIDSTRIGLGGASLGGLMAAYGGYARADVIRYVVALSPSYGWTIPAFPVLARELGAPAITRFYQATGSIEDNDIEEMRRLLVAQGFREDVDFRSVVVSGATHSPRCWATFMRDALRFLFDPRHSA